MIESRSVFICREGWLAALRDGVPSAARPHGELLQPRRSSGEHETRVDSSIRGGETRSIHPACAGGRNKDRFAVEMTSSRVNGNRTESQAKAHVSDHALHYEPIRSLDVS